MEIRQERNAYHRFSPTSLGKAFAKSVARQVLNCQFATKTRRLASLEDH
jgi:hypothetical protein